MANQLIIMTEITPLYVYFWLLHHRKPQNDEGRGVKKKGNVRKQADSLTSPRASLQGSSVYGCVSHLCGGCN